MSLLAHFLATAERLGPRTAIIDGAGQRTSFEELARWSAALAGAWQQRGIVKGDRVLLAVPLGVALYASLAALWRLGAVAVFPEPALGLQGLRHAARTTRPKAFLADGWMRALGFTVPELWSVATRLSPRLADGGLGLRPPGDIVVAVEPEHPALISFTSGSTGAPKAIERSHAFLLSQHRAVAPMLTPRREDEVDLVAFPVFVLVNLALGVTSALPCWKVTQHDRADMAGVTDFVRKERVTRALVPPAICERLIGSGATQGLDAIFTGGGPVFPDVLEKLLAANPRLDLTVVYGSTEAEPIAHLHAADIGAADWNAMKSGHGLLAGPPVPEIELRLVDDEIVVTGEHVNKTYMDTSRNAGTKVVHEGALWHRTGDAGRIDAQGRLWLLGRLDGRVPDGALTHYPFCVEAAARFWPGVRRVALSRQDVAPVLAIEGDRYKLPTWTKAAADLGIGRVVVLDKIPLDRRHRSKIDYTALAAAVRGAG